MYFMLPPLAPDAYLADEKPDVVRPAIVETRRSMALRLRAC